MKHEDTNSTPPLNLQTDTTFNIDNFPTSNIRQLNEKEILYLKYHQSAIQQSDELLYYLIKFFCVSFIGFFLAYFIFTIINKPTGNLSILWGTIEGITATLIGIVKFIEIKKMDYYNSLDKKQDREQIYKMIQEGIADSTKKADLIEKLVDDYIK